MGKFAALIGIASANMFSGNVQLAADADTEWVNDCEFRQDYTRYKFLPKLVELVDCRDSCMAIHSHAWTLSDLDHNLNLDKCEQAYMYHGMGYEPEECIKFATMNGDLGLVDIIKGCAHEFKDLYCPVVDGVPFADDE